MKLKFIASALCLVMGLSLSAQTTKDKSADKAPKQYPSEKMIQDLKLTPKQVSELKAFRDQQEADREKFRQEQKTDNTARKAAMDKKRDENRAKIKSILTPDQYTKYLEMRVDQKSKMDKRSKDGNRKDGKKFKGDKKGGQKSCDKACTKQSEIKTDK